MAHTLPEHGDEVLMSSKSHIRLESGGGKGGMRLNRRRNVTEGSRARRFVASGSMIPRARGISGAFADQTVKG